MPGELTNQSIPSVGAGAPGAQMIEMDINKLIVVTFEDSSQAEGLYEALVELDKQKIVNISDAVFVSKNEDGALAVDEKVHHEKRTGTAKGAAVGGLIGFILGGPVLGLAGGAVAGRLIGKKMDLGIDDGTIESISKDIANGHTALFLFGSAKHRLPVIEAFKKFNGKIIEATVEEDVREKLQKALDS